MYEKFICITLFIIFSPCVNLTRYLSGLFQIIIIITLFIRNFVFVYPLFICIYIYIHTHGENIIKNVIQINFSYKKML
jgi:hypothetical protein